MLGLKMLETRTFPPNHNIDPTQLDAPDNIKLPTEPLNNKPERVLIAVRGFGGYNCAVLLGQV